MVNHCTVHCTTAKHSVGISTKLRCAEDPYSVSARVMTLTFIYEVTIEISTIVTMKIYPW